MFERLFASRKKPFVPNRDKLETLTANLSGSRFSISVPPNSVPDINEEYYGPRIDIYNREAYDDLSRGKWYQEGRMPGQSILKRHWGFYGPPWIAMEYGFLSLIIRIFRVDDLPESMSCFNPHHLEQVILRDLYFRYGPPKLDMDPRAAPIKWQKKNINGTDWLYCEAHPKCSEQELRENPFREAVFHSQLYVPLDDQYFINVYFSALGYAPAKYSIAAMDHLITETYSTLQLELSPAMQQRKADVAQQCPNSHFSETRSPELWIYHKVREGNCRIGEDLLEVVEKGSPPPSFTP
ncbi:hypothetical protein [Microbulbifer sp. GL-2]|uniref:hypothetical protein n=1 Tax=Microbulbifer sp. GL-2 TaxID=2591606 RepID=UPI0011635BF1|nr:hypothetical protein [Microbulbifer sp. GL-2]BBM01952.1 hypothetical protein GL2_20260 [Microbulbifer sp. GL-2]